ncbi:MAG: hypothetical protein MR763_04110 [Clostridiales bacterium]|nr:hypothetical protein [Clostridiales bacterium]
MKSTVYMSISAKTYCVTGAMNGSPTVKTQGVQNHQTPIYQSPAAPVSLSFDFPPLTVPVEENRRFFRKNSANFFAITIHAGGRFVNPQRNPLCFLFKLHTFC